MQFEKLSLRIGGMSCEHCERAIEAAVKVIPGVVSVAASLRGNKAEIRFDPERASAAVIRAAIEAAGYTVSEGRGGGSLVAMGLGVALSAAYLLANATGAFNGLPSIDASLGYGMLFVAGLLTSVHCVAMCGGIALSQSVRMPEAHPSAGPGMPSPSPSPSPSKTLDAEAKWGGSGRAQGGYLARLSPGLLYNAGRLFSYTIVGGIVGALGAAVGFSPLAKGLIAGAAGVFMILFGLKMLGLIQGKRFLARLLPPAIAASWRKATRTLRGRGPFAVGALNGFMPCGPLQTMQLYALGTGSLLAGAFSMFVFAAGTIPLMLVFGLVAASIPRRFLPHMVRASAVLVLLLGVMTIGRASALAGLSLPGLSMPRLALGGPASGRLEPLGEQGRGDAGSKGGATPVSLPAGLLKATIEGGVQTVSTVFGPGSYVPFAVQVGVPVKWTIRIAAGDLNGCNNPISIPALNLQRRLVPGDNLIEFTPTKVGSIAYSCWMGMIRSRITVVERLDSSGPTAAEDAQGSPLLPGPGDLDYAQGLGSCCASGADPAFAEARVPVDTIGLPVIAGGVQRITVRVDGRGFSPAAIVLQKGMKAVITFDPVEITTCNASVSFPEYAGELVLARGQLSTPEIAVDRDFTFQCWMGMLHGYVKAVDDLATADIEAARKEIAAYAAPGSGGCCGSSSL